MNVNDTFKDIIPLKQWCLVNSNKIGRAVEKINGKWSQLFQDNGLYKGISTANNPEHHNWLDYSEAKEALSCLKNNNEYCGIGLIVNSPIAVIDLDHCIDEDGFLNPLAKEILNLIPETYVELSKSGHGLHFYMLYTGSYFFAGNPKKTVDGQIEIFTCNKVAVMTGNSFGEVKPLVDYTDKLNELIAKYYPEKIKVKFKSDYRPSFFDETSTATVIVNGKSLFVHELDSENKRLLDAYLQKAVDSEIDFLAHNSEGSRHIDFIQHVTQLAKLSAYFTIEQKENITDRIESAYVGNNVGSKDERDLARHFQRSFEKAWLKGEVEKPRIINLSNGHTQKTEIDRLRVIPSGTFSDNGELLSFINYCFELGRSRADEISDYLNVSTESINARLNIGFYNGDWCGNLVETTDIAYTIPVYSANKNLVGVKLVNNNSVISIGLNNSLWFEGYYADTVIITDRISEALYLNDKLNVTAVSVGNSLDSESYLRILNYKNIIAYGSKKFITRAKNTFNTLIPLDVDVLKTKGGKLYKWVEAVTRKLGCVNAGSVFVFLDGQTTTSYDYYSNNSDKAKLIVM